MNQINWSIQKILVLFVAIIAGITMMYIVFTMGAISISAPSGSDITIKKYLEDSDLTAKDSYIGALRAGEYTIEVTKGDQSTKQIVRVSPFSFTSKKIQLSALGNIEPLTNIEYGELHYGENSFSFIDSMTRELTEIRNDGTVTLKDGYYFNTIKWLNSSTGVGIAHTGDLTYHLYKINGSDISQFSSDDIEERASLFIHKDKTYLIDRGYLYSIDSNGNKNGLFAIEDRAELIAVMPNSYITSLRDDITHNISINSYDKSGKKKATFSVPSIESPDYQFATSLSPDSTKLLIVSSGMGIIYDEKLKELVKLPESKVITAAWSGDKTIVYGYTNRVWQYDFEQKISRAVANTDAGAVIDSITVAGSNKIIFTSLLDNQRMTYQTVATDKTIDKSATILGKSNINILTDTCSIYFTNLAKPIIIATTTTQNLTTCHDSIAEYLQSIYITEPIQIKDIIVEELDDLL